MANSSSSAGFGPVARWIVHLDSHDKEIIRIGPTVYDRSGRARQNEEARFPDALYRLVWLMLDQDKKFIPVHVKREDVPLCWKFCEGDKRLESA